VVFYGRILPKGVQNMGAKRKKQVPSTGQREVADHHVGDLKQQVKAAIESENHFIGNMAYQIRTLSNAIMGFSELLCHEQLTGSQTEYVSEICQAAGGLVSLVNDAVDLSRIEANILNINMSDCSMNWLLERIDSLMRCDAEEKGLEFELIQCTELPAKIHTDSVRLRQCLVNLVNNAIKFTDEGYVHIKVSLEHMDNQPFVRFDIADSGKGICIDDQNSIFKPFGDGEAVHKNVATDTGLGLSITSGLTRLLGGTISITSSIGEGSLFSLMIPVGVDVDDESMMNPHEPSATIIDEQEIPACQECIGEVLLVEDEPSNRTVMALLLETMGVGVTVAQDGIEAIEKIEEKEFDVVLMDIKMPRMDGYEATKKIHQKGISTPVVALTASDLPADGSDCDGFDHLLRKPVDSAQLYKAIRKYLPVAEMSESE
jgi:CheY-like chemotaxis protein/nitrogen-specific signal transduction histidine kinase